MDFDLDPEQRELRDTTRRFLEKEAPIEHARAMGDDARGYSDEVWKQLAALGWTGLTLPEAHGGSDAGFISLAIVLIEMGRVVLPEPFLPSTLAGIAIARFGTDEQRARLLPGIASGDRIGTVAHEGRVDADGDVLRGARTVVAAGNVADVVVTPVHVGGDDAILAIAEPAERTPVALIDQTRKVADLRFDGARFERLGSSTRDDVHWVLRAGALAVAAETVGVAERAHELAVAYAKEREQFGRPIGSFQAVKHRLADMQVDVDSMRNAVYYAAWALEREIPDAPLAVSTAKAFVSEAGQRVTRSALQVHGGIGFTWEHDLHFYLKRAAANAVAFMDATFHLEQVAQLIDRA